MYFTNSVVGRYLDKCSTIVFDLNGLIIDDELIQLKATNDVLKKFDVQLTTEFWITNCVGHKPMEYFPGILNNYNDIDFEELISFKDDLYGKYIEESAKKITRPGVIELIIFVRDQTKKNLALATSTTRKGAEIILGPDNLDILGMFDQVITGDQVAKAKPDPEIYLRLKMQFSNKNSFLVFEDSKTGVISAKAAAASCIAVPNEFTIEQDLSMADLCISDLLPTATLLNVEVT